ncbi:hypothetical protein PUNSTDRAFT_139399 [Punctularia strigosozonata HHB-11173 SS5]|uniref:Uncharacterized protein n=1 Tax=Punctularia strigosozonata (strain HHB-11173) TaxID=741275 RepID=R7RZV9_PUNST|nr:uncharacterized protein PUNSTDRAFT_139399 [Punctularia strigosozonata HHB-11173 SS5]EIN03518.1 hypothetical protein PUNSTDRAFT_139399 [Punctularia strigosozonata HHB-11173 SS5]
MSGHPATATAAGPAKVSSATPAPQHRQTFEFQCKVCQDVGTRCVSLPSSPNLPLCEACHNAGNFCTGITDRVDKGPLRQLEGLLYVDLVSVDRLDLGVQTEPAGTNVPTSVSVAVQQTIRQFRTFELWAEGIVAATVRLLVTHARGTNSVISKWRQGWEPLMGHLEDGISGALRQRAADASGLDTSSGSEALFAASDLVEIDGLSRRLRNIEQRIMEDDDREIEQAELVRVRVRVRVS